MYSFAHYDAKRFNYMSFEKFDAKCYLLIPDGFFMVVELYGQSKMEIVVYFDGRRIISEENHTGFSTLLF